MTLITTILCAPLLSASCYANVITRDLKKCDLTPDWRDAAHERAVWRAFVEYEAAELNCFMEEDEKRKKTS